MVTRACNDNDGCCRAQASNVMSVVEFRYFVPEMELAMEPERQVTTPLSRQ